MKGSHLMSPAALRARCGISLIEVVVVMGIASAMLGLAVTTIHLLMRSEHNATRMVWYGTSLARFSRTLRHDVHAATAAQVRAPVNDNAARLELTLPEEVVVTLTIEDNRINRVETAAGDVLRRETFHFPPASSIRFEHQRQPELVSVVIDRPASPHVRGGGAGNSRLPTRRLRIEAVVARDHRFVEID